MWWLLQKGASREPLRVTMSGARTGERVLQINVDDPRIVAAIAAKVGLDGDATIVVADERHADRVRHACAEEGAAADVRVSSFQAVPLEDATFDLVVVHSAGGMLAALPDAERVNVLREGHRLLRDGGRIVVVDVGTPEGLGALFRPSPASSPPAAGTGTTTALEAAGFGPVRQLADREGALFLEGIRRPR